jgi:CheY-like chemotaxis protein
MTERDRGSVLIVEDDVDARRALQWVLDLGGYATIAVGSGEAALEHLRTEKRPGVIILDLHLPRMQGDVLYTTIRAEPALSDIPVIVNTGRDAIPSMPGVFASVMKGAPPEQLLAVVDAAWGQSGR